MVQKKAVLAIAASAAFVASLTVLASANDPRGSFGEHATKESTRDRRIDLAMCAMMDEIGSDHDQGAKSAGQSANQSNTKHHDRSTDAQNLMGGQKMRGEMMMEGSEGSGGSNMMREMMQRMMGDVLPPPVDPSVLPTAASTGAKLLDRYCTQCHNLPGPGLHTLSKWPAVVARMNMRMQIMAGMGGGMMMGRVEAPSEPELKTLLAYLQRHAQKPIDAEQYADLQTSAAGKAFGATCSQCHVLPDPQQHTAGEWPNVVSRMLAHEAAMQKTLPDETQSAQIIGFLQQHGRNP